MDEGTFCEHQIEFLVESREDTRNGGGVGQHANGAVGGGNSGSRNGLWWFAVNSALESGWAPFYEADVVSHANSLHGLGYVVVTNVSTVHQAGSHVLSSPWVNFAHHVLGVEGSVGDVLNGRSFIDGEFAGVERGI